MEKWVEKNGRKKWNFENLKLLVFILNKVKQGVGLYFLGAIQIQGVWDMAEKNTQSL